MLVDNEIKLIRMIDRLISLLLRILNMLPFISSYNILINKLKKTQRKLRISLFDDDSFLTYVKMKKLGLEKNALSINTISLGSSHTDYSFYSPMWKNSYNLGLTSGDLFISYQLYEKNKSKLTNLKYIIFFYSVFSSGYSLINTSESYRVVAYKFFFDIPYAKRGIIKSKFEKYILKKCEKVKID